MIIVTGGFMGSGMNKDKRVALIFYTYNCGDTIYFFMKADTLIITPSEVKASHFSKQKRKRIRVRDGCPMLALHKIVSFYKSTSELFETQIYNTYTFKGK